MRMDHASNSAVKWTIQQWPGARTIITPDTPMNTSSGEPPQSFKNVWMHKINGLKSVTTTADGCTIGKFDA